MFSSSTTFCGLVVYLVGLINQIIPVLAGIALLVFLYGCFLYIYKTEQGSHNTGRETLWWGIVALFVLFSIWGILQIAQQGLGVTASPSTSSCS